MELCCCYCHYLCTLICMLIYLSTNLSAYIFHLRYIHSCIHFQINLAIHWIVLIYLLFPFSHVPLLLCPRLANTIEDEGGVDKIIITHSDNIQDHDKWAARFPNAKRIMHRWVGCDSCVVPPPPAPCHTLFVPVHGTPTAPPAVSHQLCFLYVYMCGCVSFIPSLSPSFLEPTPATQPPSARRCSREEAYGTPATTYTSYTHRWENNPSPGSSPYQPCPWPQPIVLTPLSVTLSICRAILQDLCVCCSGRRRTPWCSQGTTSPTLRPRRL